MLELPTIKASDEFDNKSVEGRLTQEKTINLGVRDLSFLPSYSPIGQSVLGNSLQLSVNPFSYLLKKNLNDILMTI